MRDIRAPAAKIFVMRRFRIAPACAALN